jgi:hypothetical protein
LPIVATVIIIIVVIRVRFEGVGEGAVFFVCDGVVREQPP